MSVFDRSADSHLYAQTVTMVLSSIFKPLMHNNNIPYSLSPLCAIISHQCVMLRI